MADDALRTLYCLLESGDGVPFKVKASVDDDIGDLQKMVQHERRNGALRDVDATDLTLWKVSTMSRLTSFLPLSVFW
jgi:Crinkler effector protein N-terminal domain